MTFVPFVPPAPPSRRSYELSARLKETVEMFLRENPETSAAEIRQGVRLALQSLRGRGGSEAIAVGVGLAVLGALGLLLAGRQVGFGDSTVVMMLVVGLGVVFVGLARFLKRR